TGWRRGQKRFVDHRGKRERLIDDNIVRTNWSSRRAAQRSPIIVARIELTDIRSRLDNKTNRQTIAATRLRAIVGNVVASDNHPSVGNWTVRQGQVDTTTNVGDDF